MNTVIKKISHALAAAGKGVGKIGKIKRLSLSKRQQFVIIVFFLAVGLVATQLVSIDERNIMVVGLALFTLISTLFVLREDLKGVEYIMLIILPIMFTISVSYSYFLLPVRWLTRVPTVLFYSIIMYAALLTENIYNVAAHRSIQLLRAAQTVGLLITLITLFLLFNTIFSFHLNAYLNMALVFIVSFPLMLQSLWSVVLEEKLTRQVVVPSFIVSVLFSETVFILSFWPINTTIWALFLTTISYSVISVLQQRLLERLFPNTLKEYIRVIVITFILALITTHWGG